MSPNMDAPIAPMTKAGLTQLHSGNNLAALPTSKVCSLHNRSQIAAPVGKPHNAPKKKTVYLEKAVPLSERRIDTITSESTKNKKSDGTIETAQTESAARIPAMIASI